MAALHGDITDDLGARIASGELPTGAVLTLAGLESEYDASRTVVREAVRVLETMGLVASRRRVGITVRPRDDWDAFSPQLIRWSLQGPLRQQQLESLMEVRVAIEPTAARLAATRATQTQRAELRRLAARLGELGATGQGASDEFHAVDVEFHALLLRASGNPQISALCEPVREVLAGRARLGLTPAVPADGTLELHMEVAEAVARSAPSEAETYSRDHMMRVWNEIHAD